MRDKVERAPLRFYFEHRQRIEEWAALRSEADAYARSLLEEMCGEMPLPERACLHWDRGGTYEGAVLYLPEWATAEARPEAGIGIGWGSRPNIGQPDGSGGPWWGVWRGATEKEDPVPNLLKVALKEPAATIGLKPGNFSWWPFWVVLPPPAADWYDDLASWAAGVYAAVAKEWQVLARPLSEAMLKRAADT